MCERKYFAIVSVTIDLCQSKIARPNTPLRERVVVASLIPGSCYNISLFILLQIADKPFFISIGVYYCITRVSIIFPHAPFGVSFMQSPLSFNPHLQASNVTPSMASRMATNMAPNMTPSAAPGPSAPQWAEEIMEDINSIKQPVSKIDLTEKFVNNINLKVETLDVKVN